MSGFELFHHLVLRLSEENLRIGRELCRAERKCRKLDDTNANLQTERDAADVLLGAAMDCLLGEAKR
jgi:hypothetical protein